MTFFRFYDIICAYLRGVIVDCLRDYNAIFSSDFEKSFGKFSTIFFNSNENLPCLFNSFSVVDKNILSVVGSGEQYLWARYKGASSVDTFDINRLTIHYLYLRKWLIKYFDMYYFDVVSNDKISDVLPKILKCVKCESENELNSFNFWQLFIINNSSFTVGSLFNMCKAFSKSDITDIELLKSRISSDDINFFEQDLGGHLIIPKKYDMVIASNIMEHLNLNKSKVVACRDNLHSLLNDNGEVICTYLLTSDFDYPTVFQKDIFREKFDVRELYSSDGSYPVGYSYIKR